MKLKDTTIESKTNSNINKIFLMVRGMQTIENLSELNFFLKDAISDFSCGLQ